MKFDQIKMKTKYNIVYNKLMVKNFKLIDSKLSFDPKSGKNIQYTHWCYFWVLGLIQKFSTTTLL